VTKKQSNADYEYWIDVFIALSQITFGIAWGAIFLPLDTYKIFVVVLNIVISALFILAGWFLRKRL